MGFGETPARLTTLATEFNKSVSANADILASDVTVPADGILRVTVALDTAAVFSLRLTRGGTTQTLEYNGGSSLTADALYLWDAEVRSGDTINFRSDTAATVLVLNASLAVAQGP